MSDNYIPDAEASPDEIDIVETFAEDAVETADATITENETKAAHSEELRRKLWAVADELRGKMSADEYKDYMLGFIFYKYLSENLQGHLDEALSGDGITFLQTDNLEEIGLDEADQEELLEELKNEALETLGYYLPPSLLFCTLAQKAQDGEFIIDDLHKAFAAIETSGVEAGNESFDSLFEDIDLTSTKLGHTVDVRNKLISRILVLFTGMSFSFADADADLLGDAYEYLIGQFASGSGKKGGEFYTPQQVSSILSKLVTTNKTRIRRAYDPTCGSGSLLLRLTKEADVSEYFGQEMNRTTYNLARMNMMLHGVKPERFHFANNDTLEHPSYTEHKFDAIVANPPFSAHWSASDLYKTDERFSAYGVLAPKTKADFAFVQHMLHLLDDNGIMAVVVPHGVLFRGASEGTIRKYMLENLNVVDAVIGLPANIFYGTSIPTAILVFRKDRQPDDGVLFIDASQHFVKGKNQNVLGEDDITRIVDTYRNRVDVEKLARVVPLSEISENDCNLNITRYVSVEDEEVEIDLAEVSSGLRELVVAEKKLDEELSVMLGQLGLDFPTTESSPIEEM